MKTIISLAELSAQVKCPNTREDEAGSIISVRYINRGREFVDEMQYRRLKATTIKSAISEVASKLDSSQPIVVSAVDDGLFITGYNKGSLAEYSRPIRTEIRIAKSAGKLTLGALIDSSPCGYYVKQEAVL